MKRAFAGVLLLTFVLCGAGGAHAQSTEEGARLYAVNCSMCHGDHGQGIQPARTSGSAVVTPPDEGTTSLAGASRFSSPTSSSAVW